MELRSTKLYQSPIALKGLELFLDNTFLIDPSQHVQLKQLKNHIDINYGEKETDGVLNNLVIQSHRLLI